MSLMWYNTWTINISALWCTIKKWVLCTVCIACNNSCVYPHYRDLAFLTEASKYVRSLILSLHCQLFICMLERKNKKQSWKWRLGMRLLQRGCMYIPYKVLYCFKKISTYILKSCSYRSHPTASLSVPHSRAVEGSVKLAELAAWPTSKDSAKGGLQGRQRCFLHSCGGSWHDDCRAVKTAWQQYSLHAYSVMCSNGQLLLWP